LDFQPAQIQELIEIVRMFDILGAEVRYKEYGLVLYDLLNGMKIEEWLPFADRIPASYDTNNVRFYSVSGGETSLSVINICVLGSRPLLLHILKNLSSQDFPVVFGKLCEYGHFELAFEIDHLHFQDKNIHNFSKRQITFLEACIRLDIAQQIYGFGGYFDIETAFSLACAKGHLSVCQWLYNLGNVDIHFRTHDREKDIDIDEVPFTYASMNGQLSILQWLITLQSVESFNLQGMTNGQLHYYFNDFVTHKTVGKLVL
jgi:hypothetical protein